MHMKISPRLLLAIEVSMRLVVMAVLARVLVPATGVLASPLLTSFASAAFRSPVLGIVAIVVALMLFLAIALTAILIPLRVVRVRTAIGDNRSDR